MKSIEYISLFSGVCLGLTGAVLFKLLKARGLPSASKTIKYAFSAITDCKMVMVVRTDLNMGKGKIAAQCCHAAVACYNRAERDWPVYVKKWLAVGQPKVVVRLDHQDGEDKLYELKAMADELGIPCKVIHDAGHTQVKSGTATCAGFGPAPASLVDQITKKFKLL